MGGRVRSSSFSFGRCIVKAATEFTKILIHKEPVDMRRGINGLCDLVERELMGDLTGKNLFVFAGRRKDSVKVLYFDKSGFCLWQKRLDRDRFPWPKKLPESVVTVTPQMFEWLLEGFDVWKMKPFDEMKFERVS